MVFVGYGLIAPAQGDEAGYDAYAGLDVRDKWVLALRFLPEDVSSERRQYLNRYAGVRYEEQILRNVERIGWGLVLATVIVIAILMARG